MEVKAITIQCLA